MSDLLEIRNLRVQYTSAGSIVHALNGVDLSLGRKETIGLVGETGAGKTTTALSILSLLPERSARIMDGSILFDGVELTNLNDTMMRAIRGARISMIFQDPMTSLNPVQPIGQQIEEALILHNYDKKSRAALYERTDELLSLVGIQPERRKSYPHELSGGMKQRVVIAIALACRPELLIADEPTTALDVTIQAQVLEMMSELKQQMEMSMIMITHDMGIVAKTCDKVAVMYAGEIVEQGSWSDLFENDRHHPYTTGLFGSIPDITKDERRLKPIEGLMPDPTSLPDGCLFHPRCPNCTEECRVEHPLDHMDGSHTVKCHLFDGVRNNV